jgi:hypothetical protein
LTVLVVRHGAGRGRLPDYVGPVLGRLAELDPELHRALRFHETGMAPPDLSGARAVVFWLGDPLRELYPGCFADASAIESQARARGLRVVNPPSALSNSIKSVQAKLWLDAGIPASPCVPFRDRAELDGALAGLAFPVLLKGDRMHSQDHMHFCRSAEEVRALSDAALPLPGIATPFVDTREGWATKRPGSIWARYYHKKRVMIFGDAIQARHVFFSENPIVGLTSSLGRHGRKSRRRHLVRIFGPRGDQRAMLEEDYAFFRSDGEAAELMLRAARALGFGYAALDYATFADGRVMLWEANPYPAIPGPGNYTLPKERRFEERFDALCRGYGGFFARLLA